MKYNPYQRIDKIGQKGHIDTPEKFRQLTEGIDLAGKRVLDIGCNLGAMCAMAEKAGAKYVLGIDTNRDYIEQARKLWPDLKFNCLPAQGITGTWDLIIMSAIFHYLRDPERVLNQVARCLAPDGVVTMDVWLIPDNKSRPAMYWQRKKWIPNYDGFQEMAWIYFESIKMEGRTLAPDDSERWIYRLVEPKPIPAKAVIIYGKGGAGKTTLASTYFDYAHLQMDAIFVEWRRNNTKQIMSVRWYADAMYAGAGLAEQYRQHTFDYVKRWLNARINRDIVIAGYDLTYPAVREGVLGFLSGSGWKDVEVIAL